MKIGEIWTFKDNKQEKAIITRLNKEQDRVLFSPLDKSSEASWKREEFLQRFEKDYNENW